MVEWDDLALLVDKCLRGLAHFVTCHVTWNIPQCGLGVHGPGGRHRQRDSPVGHRGDERCDGPHGMAVLVDPMKLNLKPPGIKRLKLECDEALSNFAYNFNLCRYTMAVECGAGGKLYATLTSTAMVGQCRLTPSNPR